ncbi:MAG: hypothetical protein ACP5MI_08070 [Candidatus Kryptoniota bacterium]
MTDIFNSKQWTVRYSTEDGGRIEQILYKGFALLKDRPLKFRPPEKVHGRYEDRPVYGYDDCFPSVVACQYPKLNIEIPDHGELCWLKWGVTKGSNHLIFETRSKILPLHFMRRMDFDDNSVLWSFEVKNEGTDTLPFQHVMHPLIAVSQIRDIEFPDFQFTYDWDHQRLIELKKGEISHYLINHPSYSYSMLFLQNVSAGRVRWTYKNGLSVTMSFPAELFPTIGVWWNNLGYPDEDNLRRDECSFEPVPGLTSDLSQAYSDGKCLFVQPEGAFQWQVKWEIS